MSVLAYTQRVNNFILWNGRKNLAVDRAAKRHVTVSDMDVLINILQIRMKFYILYELPEAAEELRQLVNEKPNRFPPDDSYKIFGVMCSSIDDILKYFAENGEHILKRKSLLVNNKKFSEHQLFSCFKFRKDNKATFNVR